MKRLKIYLHAHRVRHAFTEGELAFLVGYRSGSMISRLEQGERQPRLRQWLGLQILFGLDAAELFPAYFAEVEESVMRRAYELHERLRRSASAKARPKMALLREALKRATERHPEA